jgi:hypothetical protein
MASINNNESVANVSINIEIIIIISNENININNVINNGVIISINQ